MVTKGYVFLIKTKEFVDKKGLLTEKRYFLNMKYLKRALKMKETHIGKKKKKKGLFCQLNWQVAGDPELLPCLAS